MNANKTLQAIADGLLDAGVEVVTNFPGFMSHELFGLCGGIITSVNEKAAYEIAWGSSLGGKRSMVTFKNVGLNDAADPFLNSHLLGINGGFVVVVFDDIYVKGSQCKLDSRHYFEFYGGLWLEPYSNQSAYDLAYKSFMFSETVGLPVVIRITNETLESLDNYKRQPKAETHKRDIAKNHKNYVIHPTNNKFQSLKVSTANTKTQKLVDSLYDTKPDEVRNISFGCCNVDSTNAFQVFTYPLPSFLVNNTSNNINTFEQGDSYGTQKLSIGIPKYQINRVLQEMPDYSNQYIVTDNYVKLFSALKDIPNRYVIGDLGEYTKDSLDSIDACLCFGSSLNVGMGAAMATSKNVFVVIGDAAFLHSGKNALPEIVDRDLKLNIIVIDNNGSQGTGGQKIPGDLETIAKQSNLKTLKVDYEISSVQTFRRILDKMNRSKKASILIIKK